MDDNITPHKANIVNQYFEVETKEMEKPLKSPDLYPIKHVWDVFSKADAAMESYYIQYPKDNLFAQLKSSRFMQGYYSNKGEQHKVLPFVISFIVL